MTRRSIVVLFLALIVLCALGQVPVENCNELQRATDLCQLAVHECTTIYAIPTASKVTECPTRVLTLARGMCGSYAYLTPIPGNFTRIADKVYAIIEINCHKNNV